MSFILLGILNSQAAGAVGGGSYDLLETTVLGSDTASVTFSSLNSTYGSTYKHLQLRITARTDRTNTGDIIDLNFNSDTSGNYISHRLFGNGSSVTSISSATSNTEMRLARIAGGSETANVFGGMVIDMLDAFSTSKNTTVRNLAGMVGGSQTEITLESGAYFSTSAIDSMVLDPLGSFVTGSRFSLYGIKAA